MVMLLLVVVVVVNLHTLKLSAVLDNVPLDTIPIEIVAEVAIFLAHSKHKNDQYVQKVPSLHIVIKNG